MEYGMAFDEKKPDDAVVEQDGVAVVIDPLSLTFLKGSTVDYLDDLVAAIQGSCRSLFLLNFPTTGWFGDKTIYLVEKTLKRGVGRLMVTISLDGPKALHEEMRGLPGSWDRAIETFRRLRGIRRANFQTVIGMTLMEKNASKVDETIEAVRQVIPDFSRKELHLNIGHESGHYFANVGYGGVAPHHAKVLAAVEHHRKMNGASLHPVHFLEDRYQALIGATRCTSHCHARRCRPRFGAYWNLFACSIWDAKVANLRENQFDLAALWDGDRRRELRQDVVEERCSHCWTPCEAYPTILGNLAKAARSVVETPTAPVPVKTA
jgi:hypothetical protein